VELPSPFRRCAFSAAVKTGLEPAGARLGECVSKAIALTRNVRSFMPPASYAGTDF
jgi:hypothetical protein